ncbi:hypothetical protein BE15_23815 [Sorangium cellulosum]|uniref:Uncharacterized protein n=1 Tax=Sorangium cellulosum TaxID=56 RepID=A0A150QPD5_SORCE|nr:hypothetical protein BE15_23815 [Sorangium cellulosum]
MGFEPKVPLPAREPPNEGAHRKPGLDPDLDPAHARAAAADPGGPDLAARSPGAREPVEPPPRHEPPAIEETIASPERA